MPWITTPIVLALSLALAQGSEPRVTFVEGHVSLRPNGVSTGGGRAELVMPDGTLVHVDGASEVRFDAAGTLSLSEGRLLLRTGRGPASYVDVPYARLRLGPSGVFHVLADAAHGRLLVSVVVGRVDLEGRYGQSTPVQSGQMVLMTSATSALWATPFQPAGWDRFERWSDTRLYQAWQSGSASYDATADGDVALNTYPASPTCSSWMSIDNPCWLLPASPATLPGVPPYRPGPPSYAPNYRPHYAPNYNVPPPGTLPGSPQRPSAGRPEGHRPPTAPPPPSPARTPTPAARGTGGGIRIPESPGRR